MFSGTQLEWNILKLEHGMGPLQRKSRGGGKVLAVFECDRSEQGGVVWGCVVKEEVGIPKGRRAKRVIFRRKGSDSKG